MTNDELQAKFTECDAELGAMDADLGKATERQGVLMAQLSGEDLKLAKQAQAAISAAHSHLGKAGDLLAQIHDAVLPPGGQPPFTYPMPTEIVTAPFAWGESLRGYQADSTKITAMSFVAKTSGSVQLGVAEFGSPPTFRQSAFTPDFTGPSFSQGNQTFSPVTVVEGQTYTFYFRAWSSDIGPTAPQPVEGVAVEGSWPL